MTEFTSARFERLQWMIAHETNSKSVSVVLAVLDEIVNQADKIEQQGKRIAELEQERRWISVSERLPEDRQDVLFTLGGDVCSGYHISSVPEWVDHRGYFNHGRMYENITHWQPLPQPPSEEE